MHRRALRCLIPLLGLLAAWPASATNHNVEARPNFTFSPSALSITVGDTITFTNVGGLHNVAATGVETFRCANGCDGQGGNGNPATGWSFVWTFDTPGNVEFHCEVHGGMTGTITVQPVAGGDPGQIALSANEYSESEDGGELVVQIVRSGGDDGEVSVDYATGNGSAAAGNDYVATSGTVVFADNEDGAKTVSVTILDDGTDENHETLSFALSSPGGGATLGAPSVASLTILDDDTVANPVPGTLALSAAAYQATENAGIATITVQRTQGSSGAVGVTAAWAAGSAVAGTDFTPGNTQLSWAAGDGAAKTFNVPLLDDASPDGTKTINLTLQNPSGGAGLGTSTATLTVTDNENPPCVPNAETLCLGLNGRFELQVMWADFQGQNGMGKAVTIGRRDSGLFYFFSEDNIEMLVKVLDGCAINGHYWTFYAATTNVGFHLMLRDVVTEFTKGYGNDLGVSAPPVLDTSFEPCN
jgi:plastocyanin